MNVYRRSRSGLFKHIITAPLGAFAVAIIANLFMRHSWGAAVAALLVFAFFMYKALVSENIRIEIDEEGVFRLFICNKVKEEYRLSECRAEYLTKGGGLFRDILLILHTNEEEHRIDCSSLGLPRFQELWERINHHINHK